MRFREHRGGLAESMETMVELPDRAAVIAHIQKLLRSYMFEVNDWDIHCHLYSERPDTRIGWDVTYIVTLDDYGVIGFSDEAF